MVLFRRKLAVSHGNRELYQAACDEFGSWSVALQYAGVNRRTLATVGYLTPKRIQQLRRLCTTGYDLGAKVNRSRNRQLYDAALRHHGTWRAALTAVGINLVNVTHRKPKHLDRESMLLWLRNRQAAGQTIVYSEVCLENRALAIRREFGRCRSRHRHECCGQCRCDEAV